jgi:hypothetical protein
MIDALAVPQAEGEIDTATGEINPNQLALLDLPALVQYKTAGPRKVGSVRVDGREMTLEEGDAVTIRRKDGVLLLSGKTGWRAG